MKERRGIRWKETSPEPKLHREDRKERLMSMVSSVLFDVLCALIFLSSALNMGENAFPEWGLPNGFWGIALLITFGIIVGMEAAVYRKKWQAVLIRTGIFLVGALGFALYIFNKSGELLSGLCAVLDPYLDVWNDYYGMNLSVPFGNKVFRNMALGTILLLLYFVLLYLARLFRKNHITALFPFTILWLELLVGESPTSAGIIVFFAGVLLAASHSYKMPDLKLSPLSGGNMFQRGQFFVWTRAAVAVLLLCVLTTWAGREKATELIEEYSEPVKEIVRESIDNMSDPEYWEQLAQNILNGGNRWVEAPQKTKEYLDNAPRAYEEVAVFDIRMDKKPATHIYLKGFYADTYENRAWTRDMDSFAQFCKDNNLNQTQMITGIYNLGTDKLKDAFLAAEKEENIRRIVTAVTYRRLSTTTAYLPVHIEINRAMAVLQSDGNYIKDKEREELNFTIWHYKESYEEMVSELADTEKLDWEEAYEDFVLQEYTKVPDDMKSVRTIAADLDRYARGDRLYAAALVSAWLSEHTTYSLTPPALPLGEDPIEYFLGESRTGYCMHYASAGVMILRKMGVPARYVSGYVIDRSDIRNVLGRYEGTVKDSSAHAWVEIYLDGIGWVPYEMTKGYTAAGAGLAGHNGESLEELKENKPEAPKPSVSNPSTEESKPEEGESAAESESPAGSETASDEQSGETEVSTETTPEESTESASDGEEQAGDGEPNEDSTEVFAEETKEPEETDGTTEYRFEVIPKEELPEKTIIDWPFDWMRPVAITIVIGGVLLALYFILLHPAIRVHRFFSKERIQHRKVRKLMRMNEYQRAIKMMNRSVYQRLCFDGKLKKGQTDVEYGEVLKANYHALKSHEWDWYMEIVKAAVFSERELTEEDMNFCYEVYHGVIYGR